MSYNHPISPTQPISLPYSHFLTTSKLPYTPTLRTRIKPKLLVQSPPFSPLVIGRKLESCTEVIIPVGGKVQIHIRVMKDLLEDIGVGEGIEENIRERFINTFKKNYTALGLLPLEPIIRTSGGTTDDTLLLNPLTACPTHNVLSKNLIPSGSPIAFLTGVNITYEWIPYRPGSPRKQVRQSSQVGDGDEEVDNEDDDMFLINRLDGLEDELAFPQNADSEYKDGHADSWLQKQLNASLDRLLREHFIRRFPLIFDGGLLEYWSTFQLPRSIANSLTQLLHLSNTYHTPLAGQMKALIKPISQHQEHALYSSVRDASELQSRKSKRRKSSSQSQSQSQTQGQEVSSGSAKKNRKARPPDPLSTAQEVEFMEPIDRCHANLQEVADKRKEWEEEGGNKTEKKLTRIIGDVIGQIGRGNFEERRRRPGRMSYKRIELVYDDTHHESTQQTASASQSQSYIPSTPITFDSNAIKHDIDEASQYSEDELLIDRAEEYEPYNEDEELENQYYKTGWKDHINRDEDEDEEELLIVEDVYNEDEQEEEDPELLIDDDDEDEMAIRGENLDIDTSMINSLPANTASPPSYRQIAYPPLSFIVDSSYGLDQFPTHEKSVLSYHGPGEVSFPHEHLNVIEGDEGEDELLIDMGEGEEEGVMSSSEMLKDTRWYGVGAEGDEESEDELLL
ncbi:hypothetical protein I302_107686 [Kwoniella bestiolae CBS 10118]|uniref:Uncharacterized protein n=1 Tax=Kwoniella bestiolae CBS 10118 TaxID=1296100 RepID=A0A1B9FXU6_9TREE|nr:hypothetical protein I302_06575 [Kwoniella bestiolae CBS 10118]OCF23592.1 hypothetical protein I302_06575 [Kwoniella bestiolae CBS 10118]